ncbi:membrane dipeptidase [Candidatus Gracilibacteria bacterium]|nr:membrane dipeptidase [Candidatus Gracilibacteria bacterium]
MTVTSRIPVFDGHNDTLLAIYRPKPGEERRFFERSTTGHIDLPRAMDGDFGGGFFAVYIPGPRRKIDPTPEPAPPESGPYVAPLPAPLELGYAQQVAFGMIATLLRIEAASEGRLKVVHSAEEIAQCLKEGTIAAILHFEGAEMLDTDLDALEVFYRAGLRSIGPVWSRPNAFGHGVPFAYPQSPDTGPGLTEAGKNLVKACNRLRIMLDLSHLNEAGFWDVARLSDAPLVATHSNAHALCASTRNLTDKQLDAIRESDGMVGLNFAVSFLREDGAWNDNTPLATMVKHIDYLVEKLGIDRVGLGSDFDGARIPREIGDVAGLPRLLAALREHGYDEVALRKIAYENWLRVLRVTWGGGGRI